MECPARTKPDYTPLGMLTPDVRTFFLQRESVRRKLAFFAA